MSAGGDVSYGIPRKGVPDVHNLIVAGQLEKALSAVSKGTGDRILDGVRETVRPRKVPIPKPLLKSKTWSGHPIRKRLTFNGLRISVENPSGTYRTGKDPDGNEWRSLLHFDYGYIRGTTGVDKDHVDCFIGPEPNSKTVYVIHQKDVQTGKYDEDKCMLGWSSRKQAIRDYLKNYDRKDMFMSCTTMPFDQFKKKVLATEHRPRMIKAKIKTHLRRTKSGKVATVREHTDIRQKMHKKSVAAEQKYNAWLRSQPEAMKEAQRMTADSKKFGKKQNPKSMQADKQEFQSRWTTLYARRDESPRAAPYIQFAKIGLSRMTQIKSYEGVAYEFWVGERGYGIRVKDTDSDNVIHITTYPKNLKDKAREKYAETIRVAAL